MPLCNLFVLIRNEGGGSNPLMGSMSANKFFLTFVAQHMFADG